MPIDLIALAPAWKPNPGDIILGKIVRLAWNEGGKWGRYPILTLQLEDGSYVAIHGASHALKEQMMELRPKLGETAAFRDNGRKMGKNNREYYSYTMQIDRPEDEPEAEFAW
jgi:hypothetical protein